MTHDEIEMIEAHVRRLSSRLPEAPLEGILMTRLLTFVGQHVSMMLGHHLRPYGLSEGGSEDSTAHVTLGHAAVPLYGPWKFTVGDSPADPVTHAPLWAAPGFDDSHWEQIAVDQPWGSQGHQDYTGIAWYRLHGTSAPPPEAARG